MQFRIDNAQSLWRAVDDVYRLTPMRQMMDPYEIVLKAEQGLLTIYRSCSESAARIDLECDIIEPGIFLVGDARSLAYHNGPLSGQAKGDRLLIESDREARLSTTDTDIYRYDLIEFEGDWKPLDYDSRYVLWVLSALYTQVGNECVRLSGNHICCTVQTVMSWFIADEPIVDQHTAILAEHFGYIRSGGQLCINDRQVWFKSGSLLLRLQTVHLPWDGDSLFDRFSQSETVGSFVVDKSGLINALEYIRSLSRSNIFKDGLSDLELSNGRVRLVTARSPDQGHQDLDPISSVGEFKIRTIPGQIIKALGSIDLDEVTLEKKESGLFIKGRRVFHGVSEIVVITGEN